ncbi:MAG TPA: phosphate ABC transporter permease subunit PstC [Caldisericia bacterium]|nr:phosphate ABC transporter permease subunit PstC [Caldisericia bacterium]HOL83327.1 phosphate ABC transporter permease subunit PstC [Caldisericia bacterium]HON83084.1 phosphate ABC transporter permease subunit PstC [Caldisericia bacterium]HPP43970.1 phosphate ABC transporter permease subunit PstC [Caldisericia bacterium]
MRKDKVFKIILLLSGFLIVALLSGIFLSLVFSSIPSIKEFGINFLFSKDWDPVNNKFGALPFLIGTLLTSVISLLISIPFSLSISIFLSEILKNKLISNIFQTFVELIAGIPSVIVGLWGLFILAPFMRTLQLKLGIQPIGVGIFTASIILSIMIIPYSASIGKEVISMVPTEVKEGAISLGATEFETLKSVTLPFSFNGIFAGFLLSFGRAFGETMAVTMVIGNSNKIPDSIFSPGQTMASLIANEFTEATTKLYTSSLIEIGLILFIVSMLINILGRLIIRRFKF